jgi:hypothetical protein
MMSDFAVWNRARDAFLEAVDNREVPDLDEGDSCDCATRIKHIVRAGRAFTQRLDMAGITSAILKEIKRPSPAYMTAMALMQCEGVSEKDAWQMVRELTTAPSPSSTPAPNERMKGQNACQKSVRPTLSS